MELPNLEGQPGWVVVVVVALFVIAGLGTAYLRRKSADPADDPQIEGRGDTVSLPAGKESFDPVREAMTMVATQAARNADDADRAEEEVRQLAKQLAECGRDLAALRERYSSLERQLMECRARENGRQGDPR